MPQLGETVAEGTVTRWLRAVGDVIEDQEPLLEISTDKVDTEVPSPAAGTLLEIVVAEDSTVPVGTVLAVLDVEDMRSSPASEGATGSDLASPAAKVAEGATTAPRQHRHQHSPRVRRLAGEAGVSLESLRGSGPGGRVTPADVHRATHAGDQEVSTEAADAQRTTVPLDEGGRREPMSRLRQVVAERMMASLHGSAQLTTVVEVDVTGVIDLRESYVRERQDLLGVRLTLTAFFAKVAVEALRSQPVLNASIDDDGRTVVHHAKQNLGIAVDTDRGLVVPVLKDAGDLNLLGLSRRIDELARRAREGALSPDDLSGGTFTLTNTGSRGALFDTPILLPGQVGILGTGAIVERPVVLRRPDAERVIAIRSMAHLALTYDHRLVDGSDAARFLGAIKARLEAAQFAAELG
jgi:2-oxoglutarate dehydrogenase E2 component (dihydrolipoamide succinyltransferase)